MDDLDRLRQGLPMYVETAAGGGWNVTGHALSAYASCARQLNVDVELVLRAANTGRLAALIEKRGGRTASRRNLRRAHLARKDQLHRLTVLTAIRTPRHSLTRFRTIRTSPRRTGGTERRPRSRRC
jgi:hypothetical protein